MNSTVAAHAGLVILLCVSGCGGSGSVPASDERAATTSLVVGSTVGEWGLLAVPRGGGKAELRSLASPDSVIWTGSTDLPVIQDLRPLGDLMIVLLAENGRVSRYDPLIDREEQVARLSPSAVFGGASVSAVALIDFESQVVHEIATDHAAEYPVDEAVTWASPVDGGLAVLTDSEPPRLLLRRRTDSELVLDVETGGRPVLVTAWGQQVVLVGANGHSVQIYATDDGSLVGEVDVGGSISAMAASPSSHEIYVSIESPPRLVVVNRFGLSAREVTASAVPIQELRPELFGGSIFIRTADGIGQFESGDAIIRPLAGTWRSDLPLGLASGRTIVLDDDEAHLLTAGNAVGTVLAGGAPTWWIPLRWNPTFERVMDQPAVAILPDVQAQDAAVLEPDGPVATPQDSPTGEAGHYAIVVSARQRSGVADLMKTLADGGYPTR
ncbi:MAG: hypothetical protein E4H28_02000, partial [Gemmatimonadales bacterium]